jgi:hypothetical protein
MATLQLYNHTAQRFASGANSSTDTYKAKLLSAGTFDATNTTLAATGGTEVANGNGYTTGGATLANVAVTTVTTNDAKFDADDVTWAISGGTVTAVAAVLYNDTDANDPPVAFIDFGGSRSVSSGNNFVLSWNANGIFTWTVA